MKGTKKVRTAGKASDLRGTGCGWTLRARSTCLRLTKIGLAPSSLTFFGRQHRKL